jgi:hypothetical protein
MTSPDESELTSGNRSYKKLGRTRVFGQLSYLTLRWAGLTVVFTDACWSRSGSMLVRIQCVKGPTRTRPDRGLRKAGTGREVKRHHPF